MLPHSLPPLSLYIHLPWCVKKCPYCDFNSHAKTDIPESAYLNSLIKDLHIDLAYVQDREVQSIFFGGGTPSLMSGDFYRQLLNALRENLNFSEDIEITLEANPGASDAAYFNGYVEAGINRISLGVQSFQNNQLQALGRIHTVDHVYQAVEALKAAGIRNFNIDLMHGLSDQTPELAMDDLKRAFELSPTHVSWYQLTIEPNTEFYSRPPVIPEDDALWEIIESGSGLLKDKGYQQYEVSAFAQQDKQARHNLNYWEFGDYIGLGAGAHSKITLAGDGRLLRYRKSRIPEAYMADRIQYRIGEEVIERDAQAFEFMMNALRLKQGVESRLLERRTLLKLSDLSKIIDQLRSEGLFVEDTQRIQLTDEGFLFLNSVLERFL
ncbi:YggW family oxidoreductase [Oleiphilus sp. HI0009]|nr:YggW family oxidoreductase [Oleiphilus sp. HI0009]KZY65905.1 YggW family oxidoreductase [Oleiphilus sp. HI0066]KZY70887.1 YggW family oxidoreductase [Oleiphilus sp. HI0067]